MLQEQNAVFRYDLSGENESQKYPQVFLAFKFKNNITLNNGQSATEAILNKNQPRLMPMRRATVSRSQFSGTLRVLPAMSARRFSVTWRFTMATVTP